MLRTIGWLLSASDSFLSVLITLHPLIIHLFSSRLHRISVWRMIMPLSSRSDWFLRVVSVNTPRTQPSFVAGSEDLFHTPARLHDDAGKRLYQAYMTNHSCCITVFHFHVILLKTPNFENGSYNKFAQNGRLKCAILHHKLISYIIAGLFGNVSSCISRSSEIWGTFHEGTTITCEMWFQTIAYGKYNLHVL